MDAETPLAILSLAFGFGVLHALDADHVMAVTALSSQRPSWRVCLSFAARWAAGHSVSLFTITLLTLLVGLRIPPELARLAEWLVAAILIGIGIAVLSGVVRGEFRLELPQHPGHPPDFHWRGRVQEADAVSPELSSASWRESLGARGTREHGHSAVFIGALHGLTGSAPLLALIPAVAKGNLSWALGYITLFSIGVLLAMVVCGGLFSGLAGGLLAHDTARRMRALRATIGVGAIAVGTHVAVGLATSC